MATYEAGNMVTMCAWCERVELDGEWVLAPRAAITAIDAQFTLSHSICPGVRRSARSRSRPRGVFERPVDDRLGRLDERALRAAGVLADHLECAFLVDRVALHRGFPLPAP